MEGPAVLYSLARVSNRRAAHASSFVLISAPNAVRSVLTSPLCRDWSAQQGQQPCSGSPLGASGSGVRPSSASQEEVAAYPSRFFVGIPFRNLKPIGTPLPFPRQAPVLQLLSTPRYPLCATSSATHCPHCPHPHASPPLPGIPPPPRLRP